MKFQSDANGCGAAALANALSALGFSDVPQETVAELAGATATGAMPDGLNAVGLQRAARRLGACVAPLSLARFEDAWLALRGALLEGRVAVLLFDKGDHWVTAVGLLGDEVVVADPAGSVRPQWSFMDRAEVERVWRWKTRKPWYGILVGRAEEG